ncbi:MAG: hypothetical protein JWR33_2074 [Naasia sp.]|uniref:DUF1353 domain-containing protein n=1 Tax=Naasia sp. TaxID=2546198 RepID=UPI002626ADC1|nr:DUF1353 domain-containing protein [Naasia sp.]MCU1571333.1 hypothetical protein [Naasia sp.]
MPFFREDGRRLDRVALLQRAPGTFQLLRPFSYLEQGRPEEERIVVRAHDEHRPAKGSNATDLASVPTFLWGLISSHGRQTAPALLHDQLWWESLNPDTRVWIAQRREADRIFKVALRETGTTPLRTALLWSAVSVERYWGARRWQAVLLALQVLAGIAAIWLGLSGLLGWPGLALLALPALASLAWGRDGSPVRILSYSGVLFLPVAIVAILGQCLLLVLELAGWLLGGRRGPRPKSGPLGRTRRAKERAARRVREAGDGR